MRLLSSALPGSFIFPTRCRRFQKVDEVLLGLVGDPNGPRMCRPPHVAQQLRTAVTVLKREYEGGVLIDLGQAAKTLRLRPRNLIPIKL